MQSMNDTQACFTCGKSYEWRTIRDKPVLLRMCLCRRAPRSNPVEATDWSGGVCCPTKCPQCRAPVYFVRHNGGSVWFDELGIPWPKHGCMISSAQDQAESARSVHSFFPTSDSIGVVVECFGVPKRSPIISVVWKNGRLSTYWLRTFIERIDEGTMVSYRVSDEYCLRHADLRRIPVERTQPQFEAPGRPLEDIQDLLELGTQYLRSTAD